MQILHVMQNEFKIYDLNQYNFDIELNDAVKITSKHNESFWVVVKSINGDIITGTVNNMLLRNHDYNEGDNISFNKNNIKILNKLENRNTIENNYKEKLIKFVNLFIDIHKRKPSLFEIERFINTKIINN